MIDRDKLMGLLGDEGMVDRMIDLFQSETPGQLAELGHAVDGSDWANASIIAHTIKSQVAYLGLDQAEHLAREIEQKAENETDLGNIPGMVNDLEAELGQYL